MDPSRSPRSSPPKLSDHSRRAPTHHAEHVSAPLTNDVESGPLQLGAKLLRPQVAPDRDVPCAVYKNRVVVFLAVPSEAAVSNARADIEAILSVVAPLTRQHRADQEMPADREEGSDRPQGLLPAPVAGDALQAVVVDHQFVATLAAGKVADV